MIKETQKQLNRIQVLLDCFCIILSVILAWLLRFESGIIDLNGKPLPFSNYFNHTFILVPLFLVLFNKFNMYKPKRLKGIFVEFSNIININIIGIIIYTLILYFSKAVDFSRYFIILFGGFNILLLTAERVTIRLVLRKIRKKGSNLKHIIILGNSEISKGFTGKIQKNKHWGYNIVGIFSDNVNKRNENKIGRKVQTEAEKQVAASIDTLKYQNSMIKDLNNKTNSLSGDFNDFKQYISKNRVDEVFIAIALEEYSKLGELINSCEQNGIRAKIIPDYYKYIPAKPYVEEVDGLPIINIRYVPLDNIMNKLPKRIFDILVSSICLVLASPVLIFTALTIKITSPGPILFKQERVGLNRQKFNMYKFRSMHVQKDEDEKVEWTTKNDPRKTKFGSFIRKTSIDELPQFINVLKGDMSIIGPRPERPYFVDKFKEQIPKYMIKHHVRPGITGWAQVNGFRGDTSIKKRIEHDIYYIENWTFGFDLKIFFMTFVRGFRNAY
ncbi:undecaprenyl-phosphate glucose phosphotransferase [Oceanirhabdus seepicola]|uniref:Undecaprenyl-phosphate glucose phosphotransferase n=1 Tax=Oceanirhabdus seepicola TaxID=2828781 RepID=A0A9J6P261_9CLOT|nr:undecaprenyl-phosphate glucose phosphotransferase [Oceanirhabdus seepicola]MCM1990278.1 undecaprenyl-phosphate glucose phosphotransferase [Oceanirhabdus seepicola]